MPVKLAHMPLIPPKMAIRVYSRHRLPGTGTSRPASQAGFLECFSGFSCSLAFGQISGTTKNPAAFAPELHRPSLKKSQMTLVIGMGVLYNGEITPVVNRNYTTAPADPDAEEKAEDLIISLYGPQVQIAERVTKKIERLDRRLTVFEEQRRSV
ncbi:MAG: hypothetical protein Q7U51_03010 [Methanoregula sp.]|nr:hypothetical protein [Methanoregula sp.]